MNSFFGVVIFFVAAFTALILAGALARVRLKRKFPPVGQMVDIGGYRLHLLVEGQGDLTVVLDSGAGGTSLAWELVRPAIAKVSRVVVYDRAGLGWSDPGPLPRDASRMADELHTLLKNAKIEGPYLLVGHSLGGVVARHFAARYPREVAGLVMVDAAHEEQMKRFPEPVIKMAASMQGMFAMVKLLRKLGFFALFPKVIPIGDQGKLPTQTAEMLRAAIAGSNSHVIAMQAETESVFGVETTPLPTLGDIPMMVISHGQLDANAIPPSLGQQTRDDYESAWQAMQVEIANLSTRSRRIIAEQSGHNVIFDQPKIVVEAIIDMIHRYQQNALIAAEMDVLDVHSV